MKVNFSKIRKPFYFVLALFMVGSFVSCDNYNEDNLRSFVAQTTEEVPITKYQTSQAVFLEEYSGWSCTNCPLAADKLEKLKDSFQENLITITIHAGKFAEPGKSNDSLDLRTVYGTQLCETFGVSSFPAGIINRSTSPLQFSEWDNAISSALSSTPHRLNINLGTITTPSRLLVGVNISTLTTISDNLLLSLFVVEDDITGIQLSGASKITDYIFNNVLRKNPLTNLPINSKPLASNETLIFNYSIQIDPIWNLSNCRVVAIVTNQQTGQVIQTNEISVK